MYAGLQLAVSMSGTCVYIPVICTTHTTQVNTACAWPDVCWLLATESMSDTCLHTCKQVHVYMYTHSMHISMYVLVAICRKHVRCKHSSLSMCIHTHSRQLTNNTHTHTHARTHARTHTHAHTCMHAQTRSLTHAHTHARTHTHTHIRNQTHTYTHIKCIFVWPSNRRTSSLFLCTRVHSRRLRTSWAWAFDGMLHHATEYIRTT